MSGFDLLYLAGLATLAGYLLVGRVPAVMHTPLLAGASLVHGVVLVGAVLALSVADTFLLRLLGVLGVAFASANVIGAFLVTDRLLALLEQSSRRAPPRPRDANASRSTGGPADATSPGQSGRDDASRSAVAGVRGERS